MQHTAWLRWIPLHVPSQKHSCGAPFHNINSIVQPKTRKTGHVEGTFMSVPWARPCCKSCAAPAEKYQHGRTCRMMLDWPIVAWNNGDGPLIAKKCIQKLNTKVSVLLRRITQNAINEKRFHMALFSRTPSQNLQESEKKNAIGKV